MLASAAIDGAATGILRDVAARRPTPATAEDHVPPDDREALAPARSIVGPEVPDALLHQGLMAWAALFGAAQLIAEQPPARPVPESEVRQRHTRVADPRGQQERGTPIGDEDQGVGGHPDVPPDDPPTKPNIPLE